MSNNQNSRGIYGKGYYIALILCAAAIGITSYVYYRNDNQEVPGEALEASAPLEEDVAAIATEPKGPAPTADSGESKTPQPRVLTTTSPVAGQEVFGYSMEALSYNQTTRDWRTHNGVDIAAEAGTEVVAAADGEVYTTYEDETLGYTVVIRHEGGYTTRYSSLGEDIRVQAGDLVKMGDVIGTVGSTALVETVLGPHVHFSVAHQDQPMDPAEFFSLGK
jgi:murein DD-endopeptidase MepM/ murein hydrolase activator NlpD